MIDQRKSGSLGRFLMRRAMQRIKNPNPLATRIPFWHGIRWKFSLEKRSLILRCGLFGLNIYWHTMVPVPNNISVDAETTGVVIYTMPLGLQPGASVPCKQWVRREKFTETLWTGDPSSNS